VCTKEDCAKTELRKLAAASYTNKLFPIFPQELSITPAPNPSVSAIIDDKKLLFSYME
jgi:hypothetical protein